MPSIENARAAYEAAREATARTAKREDRIAALVKQHIAEKEYDAAVLAKLAEDAGEPVGVLEYESNNSGGVWWVSSEGWHALADAGWTVHWGERRYGCLADLLRKTEPTGKTWMGAESCAKAGTDPQALVDEWERLTGCTASDQGCNCCGPPHDFEWHAPNGEIVSPGVRVVEVWDSF